MRPDLAFRLSYLLLVGREAEDNEHQYSDEERENGERPYGVHSFERRYDEVKETAYCRIEFLHIFPC
jgi:hypothetical protein